MLHEILNSTLLFLKSTNRPVVSLLQDGLEREEVLEALSDVGLKTTEELVTLYLWRDGTNVTPGQMLDGLHFFPGFYFCSLEDACAQYLAMKDDPRWNRDWFPVFTNGGGDFYAVDLARPHVEPTPVIGFILGESEHPVEYQSLLSMAETLLECFQTGTFFVTDDNYLEADDMKHAAIARKHNPQVAFWRTEA